MQDRYTLSLKGRRISLVYETKAQMLVVTTPADIINEVTALLPREVKSNVREIKEYNGAYGASQSDHDESKSDGKQTHGNKSDNKSAKWAHGAHTENAQDIGGNKEKVAYGVQNDIEEHIDNYLDKPQAEKAQTSKAEKTSQSGKIGKEAIKAQPKEQPQAEKAQTSKAEKTSQSGKIGKEAIKAQPKEQPQNGQSRKKRSDGKKDGVFTVDKITVERCKEFLKKIKANKVMRYKTINDEIDGSKVFVVTSDGNKATIKYAGGTMQLSGAPGDLYSELQLMLSSLSDYKTAINTHIKYVGEEKRSSSIERQLKRKLPAAFEFLSEQSKIDLAIGIIDINNSAVVLSDYSTLLIPCFRGLERLIFDLQHAQNISVKMIGQAYEKEDGEYVLKAGYRRKIPSVVYAEVMASLYSEYVKHRNFYAHSDGIGNVSRVISDKSVVMNIFNHIMDIINYNGKKLREIGFRI